MSAFNMMEMLSGEQGRVAMGQLAKQFGIEEAQAETALKALLPALSGGLKRNVEEPGGLESLMNALETGGHDRYIEQPETLAEEATAIDGDKILGHILGGGEMTEAVSEKAAARTGLTGGLMKQMMPVVAAMAMGGLSKQIKNPLVRAALMAVVAKQVGGGSGGGLLGGLLGGLFGGKKQAASTAEADEGLGFLGKMLDADGDGDIKDDIFDMVMKRR